jgi:uncharacterized protein YcaQ
MIQTISKQDARKLVLLSQKIPPKNQAGDPTATTLSSIEHLGYIQIDTISVIQRAHHHTLWNRNPRYKTSQLDQLVADKKVFEYWSHAAAYLPMRDYRFTLHRKHTFASGEQEHWYERDKPLMKRALKRIADEGPLMAKDFEHTGKKLGEWRIYWIIKPAKRALESLFMEGKLMISFRKGFHKVYDLTERVIPKNLNIKRPQPDEHARFLITQYLRANGLGHSGEMAYLLRDTKKLITSTLKDMVSNGELKQVQVADQVYQVLPNFQDHLNKPLPRSKLKILSPFDNLVIQRKRVKALFDFGYLIECYVPEAKRRYGYFVLPILWDGKLVARMDCKAERKESLLHIHHLALEPLIDNPDLFIQALRKELKSFLRFNQCKRLKLHKTTPKIIRAGLLATLKDLLT